MGNVRKGRSTTTKPDITFEEMLNAIGDSLSNLGCSQDEVDGEDEDVDGDDTGHGKLSEDDELGWVMGTISTTIQHHIQSVQQKHIRLDELTQPGWRDAADHFRVRDMNYGTTELRVPAVGKPKTDSTAATPSLTTCGEHMQPRDIAPAQSQMPHVMSPHGSSQMMRGSEKHHLGNYQLPLKHSAVPDLSKIGLAK